MKKKVLVLLYDGFVGFELVLATTLLKYRYEIVTTAPEMGPFTESSGLLVSAHQPLGEVDMNEYEALVIPGGQWDDLLKETKATKLIQDFYANNKVIGAICAAPIHLAKAGVLQDKKFTTSLPEKEDDYFEWDNFQDGPVVVDGKIVTAKGNAYLEFAFALADQLGLYTEENQEERENDFKYLKNAL